MAYTLNLKYTDATGKLEERTLTGPHVMALDAMASPLAVELIPKNDVTYDLLVTAGSNKKQGTGSGTGKYEIFIGHHRPECEVVEAGLANGPHFMVLNPLSETMTATLVEIPTTPAMPTRLYLSLTEPL